MVVLPDVNVLVALVWPNHVHHERVHEWLGKHRNQPWATCPLTQSGFVRVSSNRQVTPAAKSPREALALLEMMVAHPRHRFLTDDVSIADRRWIGAEKLITYRQVTDAHLLALALKNRAQLLTLDRTIVSLIPEGFDRARAVVVIA